MLQIGLFLAIILLTFLLLIRPQLTRMRRHDAFLAALKVGDVVVSGGGLIGKIVSCEHLRFVELELADRVIVRALRSSLEAC